MAPALVLAGGLVLVPALALLLGGRLIERVAVEFLINVVLVVGLQIFVGNAGIISFGHAAFMGLGAYASVLLTLPAVTKARLLPDLYVPLDRLELPFPVAAVSAAVLVVLIAAVVGFPLMRLSGSAAAIATFALLVVVHVVLINWTRLTRGTSPIFGVPAATTIWLAYGAAALAVVAAFAFKESSLGIRLRASREDERAAAAMGVNVIRVRLAAFALSAGLTALGGALWAHFIVAFTPDAFFFAATFSVLTMLIIGGMRSVTGAVVGTVVVSVAFQLLRNVESGFAVGGVDLGPFFGLTPLVLALGMLLVLIHRPEGIVGGRELSFPNRRIGRPRRKAPAEAS